MNIKRMIFTLLIVSLGVGVVSAQAKLKRARAMMESLNYQGAIEVYNQVLEKDDNPEAKINIAECYRKINNSEDAEYWYGQVVQLSEVKAIHWLYYGQQLQRNGKCDLAQEWYQKYVEAVPEDIRGQYLVKACDYEEELLTKNAGIYEVNHTEINSNLDDFSPAFYGDGIIFASERDKGSAVKRQHTWTGLPFLELYYVDAKADDENNPASFTFGTPEKFSKEINSKFHEAAVSLSSDQQEIFFTRNNFEKGKKGVSDDGIIKLKVYHAKSNGGESWDDLEGLPFNSDEYSVAHPSLNVDGTKLYFCSDMPGGFGGMDLYLSEKEGGQWGPPLNLGPDINTEGNELFPYYQKDGRLYFSSDGHIGLGGLDIYYLEDKGDNEWGMIENMGYPVNTISDDFGIVFNEKGTAGFFSSDRDGGAGRDDIYTYLKNASPVEIFVYDEKTKEPIEGATVLNECSGLTLITGEDGKVTIDQKMNICCSFTASFEEYMDNSEEGCTKDIMMGDKVIVEIPLSKEMEFSIEGVVFDESTGLPLEGVEVLLTSDCEDVEDQMLVTDSSGAYSFELQEDCCYTIKGTKDEYLAAIAEECTRDLTESTIIQTNLRLQPYIVQEPEDGEPPVTSTENPFEDHPELYRDPVTGLITNKGDNQPFTGEVDGVTYTNGQKEGTGFPTSTGEEGEPTVGESYAFLLDIYYDFDQSYIRDESEPELDKLKRMLDENPEVVVEIGSHTDSRGTYRYNRRLSQRRAESVVRWLVDKGVERSRLEANGFGETENVNNCKNNIPCSEQEHQMNRRTEFRVVGGSGDERSVSKPNPDARVDDSCQGCPF